MAAEPAKEKVKDAQWVQNLTVMKLYKTRKEDKRHVDQVMEHYKQSTKHLFSRLDQAGKVLKDLREYKEKQIKLKERAQRGLGIFEKEKEKMASMQQQQIPSVLDGKNGRLHAMGISKGRSQGMGMSKARIMSIGVSKGRLHQTENLNDLRHFNRSPHKNNNAAVMQYNAHFDRSRRTVGQGGHRSQNSLQDMSEEQMEKIEREAKEEYAKIKLDIHYQIDRKKQKYEKMSNSPPMNKISFQNQTSPSLQGGKMRVRDFSSGQLPYEPVRSKFMHKGQGFLSCNSPGQRTLQEKNQSLNMYENWINEREKKWSVYF